jgi:flagellar FliJ protein
LRLKAHREKEQQKIHSEALQNVYRQREYLNNLYEDRIVKQTALRRVLHGKLNIGQLLNFSRYFIKQKKDELSGVELLKAFKINSENKRKELVEATRQRKIYEKLKERRFDSYKRETLIHTQKEQDEIASQLTQHKKAPGKPGAKKAAG